MGQILNISGDKSIYSKWEPKKTFSLVRVLYLLFRKIIIKISKKNKNSQYILSFSTAILSFSIYAYKNYFRMIFRFDKQLDACLFKKNFVEMI